MKIRRTLAVYVIIIAVVISLIPAPIVTAVPLSGFYARHTYVGQFDDVSQSDWFAPYVRQAYEFGLMRGSSGSVFSPNGNLTIAQTITLAVRIHSIHTTGAEPDLLRERGEQWYQPYVNYALEHGIIASVHDYDDYGIPAIRSEVAVIFQNALTDSALTPIREVQIPDVAATADYASAVFALYRAGVLSGSDGHGTFNPASYIRRSEIAAVIVRIADPARRDSRPIGPAPGDRPVLTPAEVFERYSPAVFYLRAYAFNGSVATGGGGFFISADGFAITSFDAVANTSALAAQTPDGRTHGDITIVDTDPVSNLALIRVGGSGFAHVTVGDSAVARAGETVYAIYSPRPFENAVSQGIVSTARQGQDAAIQVTAQTTRGGALFNNRGEVIGLIAGESGAAVPIELAQSLNRNADVGIQGAFALRNYPRFAMAVDFGAFSGVRLQNYIAGPATRTLQYDLRDFTDGDHFVETLIHYHAALMLRGFEHEEIDEFSDIFTSGTETVTIELDFENGRINIRAERMIQHYSAIPGLIDFGWYSGLPQYHGPEVFEVGAVMFVYRRPEGQSEAELQEMLTGYQNLLMADGFAFIRMDARGRLFESDTLSVVILADEEYIFLDILPLEDDFAWG